MVLVLKWHCFLSCLKKIQNGAALPDCHGEKLNKQSENTGLSVVWSSQHYPYVGDSNDVQLYADGQQKPDLALQALYQSLCRKQTEHRILQPTV